MEIGTRGFFSSQNLFSLLIVGAMMIVSRFCNGIINLIGIFIDLINSFLR